MNNPKDEILYIDDEPMNLSGFRFVFKKFYNIHLTTSAAEGLKILEENKIKVVITDQRMPKMSGVEFLEQAAKKFPQVYRIILTAYTNAEDIIRSINKGKIYQYIRKPWDKDELKIVIDNAIKAYNLKEENSKLLRQLKESNEKLAEANTELENKVIERTKEIIKKNIELEKHQNHLEDLVQQRTKDLEKAKIKAEESDRLKTSFLTNVSHELRTPMNAIVGFADLLVSSDFSENEKKEFKNHILINSEALLRLINDILDISKIEANQVTVEENDCHIPNLLEELLIYFKNKQIEKKKESLNIHLDIPDKDLDVLIRTDSFRLRQILLNLLENALKFTDTGFIKFGYYFDTEKDKSKYIIFFVKDSGIGIPKESQQHIFERFRKLETTKDRLYGGTGLGLFISKSLSELLGGSMWLESEPQKGTSFYFKIPYIMSDYSENKLKKEGKKTVTREYDLKGKKILIAEDEDFNYKFIAAALGKTNAKLIRAKDGVQTVEIMKSQKDINLILMDMQMPVMDGYEATQEIKKFNNEIPIIAQTAYAMSDQKEKMLKIGCADYIAKPFRPEELVTTIAKHLK